ncbi:hypothetical protein V6N13_130010 [Hibiscus sabdariffa]
MEANRLREKRLSSKATQVKFLEMAEICFSKAIMTFLVAIVLSVATTVSAQGSAAAPSPSQETGAAFSVPVSGVALTFSLIVSLLALMKH